MHKSNSFDDAASSYDIDFTNSAIGKLQRQQVWKHFSKILKTEYQSLSILEINCGTGADAITLAQMGHRVIATDASEVMIEIANNKKKESNLLSLSFEQCPFNELKEKYKGQQFDIIFSDFGGLNCVSSEELQQLSVDFSSLLKPTGSLVMVIMGTWCVWEQFYFLLKGNFKKAFRRKQKKGVETTIKSKTFTTWYFSPKEIKLIFNNHFNYHQAKPIGLFLPPSYLEPFFIKRKGLLKLFYSFEKLFVNFTLFSNSADHYFIQFTRKH